MQFIGIIPARYASTRFPGKPLADIGGKPMIQRVFEQASLVLEHVFVATDDERIRQAVEAFGGKVIMTSSDHCSGTDRCAEALKTASQLLNIPFDVVINIQGDEPFIRPEQLNLLKKCFDNADTDIATLVKPFGPKGDVFNPNHVKAVLDKNKKALYFSRSPIPFIRGKEQHQWASSYPFVKHLGIYAYRAEVLDQITQLSASSLEEAESLEQNRWLENGFTIRVEITEFESASVDTPEDLEKVKKLLTPGV